MTKVICKLPPTTRMSTLSAPSAPASKIETRRSRPSPALWGDCAVRSACWATGESYEAVFAEMQERADAASAALRTS